MFSWHLRGDIARDKLLAACCLLKDQNHKSKFKSASSNQ